MMTKIKSYPNLIDGTWKMSSDTLLEAGVVKINEPTTGLALNAPFGGFKQSSANIFKEQGLAAIDFYTRTQTIYVNHE